LAYQVIARKWRPQSFGDLVGQEHISKTLLNALRNNRLPQALLFTGVRGTGKTSSARILAKSLRCPKAKDFVPCGVCPECEDIASGRSLDVVEIDGASNNGVDAIRELRETVGYMPSSGKYKVYIIDEVHMLSTSAFNALLKTLEEPPAHVVFILATTEVQKIPSTILSRCQRFDFRRIPSRQIAQHLTKICEAEGVKTEPEAVWLIARHGDGSLRDAQSLLDQVITFCDGALTLEKVVDVLGLTDRTLLLAALEGLVKRDAQATVTTIEKILKSGYDPKVFAQDLLEEIRNALLVRLCPDDPTRVVDLPETEIESLRTITSNLTEEDLQLLFDMALKGINDLLRSQDARLVLEMLLLRMAAAPRIASLAALAHGAVVPTVALTKSSGVQQQPNAPPPVQPQAPISATAQASNAKPIYSAASFVRPANGMPAAAASTSQTATTTANAKPAATSPAMPPTAQPTSLAPAAASDAPEPVSAARANDPWYQFVERVKKSNSLLGAMLENTHLISTEGIVLTVGVPRKMSFLFDKVKEDENIKRIETFIETFWNKKFTVEVKLADPKIEKATPKAMADEHKLVQKRSVETAVEQNSLVQTAQNVFKTQIKSIKDAGAQTKPGAGKREST
jgi:DNA polymerase-3 subunit gamma/tau